MRSSGRFAPLAVALAVLAGSAGLARASNDTYFAQQWNLGDIGAEEAWSTARGEGVVIGIVDSGVDASHPDLAGKIDALASCLGGSCREGSAPDGDGHGTVVAGIAAARTGNGAGIAGVAPDAHLVIAKALDDNGTGRTEDINNAIRWVVDKGAKVVNLSLGDPDLTLVARTGTPLQPAIEYAWSRGAIPVLAAGNYEDAVVERRSANFGNLDAVVVGATEKGGAVASYSTSLGNAKWGLVAPGGNGKGPGADILSTYRSGRYGWAAGTSMAAPHVSGALALLVGQGLSPTAAVERLLATSDHSATCGEGCNGRVRVNAAVAGSATAASAPVPTALAAPAAAPGAGLSAGVVALAFALVVAAGAGAVFTALWQRRGLLSG